jgi:hypothetical protein
MELRRYRRSSLFPSRKPEIRVNKLLTTVVVGLALCLLAGCGGVKKVNATGRVIKDGKPLTVPENDFVRVQFVPYTEPGTNPKTSYIAEYDNTTGTFKALGPDLKGVPPGKYRITVAHEKGKKDLFKGAFDMPKTPFVFDIDSSTPEIVLDLDNPPKA